MHIRILLIVLFASVAGSYATAQEGERAPKEGLAVLGSAIHRTAPTIVRLFGYVSTSGERLEGARDPHPAAVAKVRSVLDQQASKGLKIVRSTYRISETYPYRYDQSPDITPEMREKVVYEAITSFELQTSDFDAIDQVATAIAATDLLVTATEFDVEDNRLPLLEARKAAARDALSQAEAYAEALHLKLIGIKSVTDGEAMPPDGYADLGVLPPDGSIRIVIPETLPFRASVYVSWHVEMASGT